MPSQRRRSMAVRRRRRQAKDRTSATVQSSNPTSGPGRFAALADKEEEESNRKTDNQPGQVAKTNDQSGTSDIARAVKGKQSATSGTSRKPDQAEKASFTLGAEDSQTEGPNVASVNVEEETNKNP